MTKVLSTQEKTFRFVDLFSSTNYDNIYCDIHIIVEELQYENGNIYYMIKYQNTFSNQSDLKKDEINKAHPFFYDKQFISNIDGDVIVKNKMTEQMINHLLMEPSELSLYSGSTTPMGYRSNIMKMIALMWD